MKLTKREIAWEKRKKPEKVRPNGTAMMVGIVSRGW